MRSLSPARAYRDPSGVHEQGLGDTDEGAAQDRVLGSIQMNAVDGARRRHLPGIEEGAAPLARDDLVSPSESDASAFRAFELRRDGAFGGLDRRRRDDENPGN